jgi:hypothetical protein
MSKYASDLRNLLSEDKIKECLDSLIISLVKNDRNLYDSCILLKARYVKARSDENRGFPDKEEINKIRYALTDILNEVELKKIGEVDLSRMGTFQKRHLFYVGFFFALSSPFGFYIYQKNIIREGTCYEPASRTEYLKKQLEYEKEAIHFFYITKALTNALATNQYLEKLYETKLKTDKQFSKEATFIYDLTKERRDNLEKRIRSNDISFVGAIFSEEETFKDTTSIGIERLKHVLELIQKNTRVKLFMISKDYLEERFLQGNAGLALLSADKNTNVVLARQVTTGKSDIEAKVPGSQNITNDRICKDRHLSESILIEITKLMSSNYHDKTVNSLTTFVKKYSK